MLTRRLPFLCRLATTGLDWSFLAIYSIVTRSLLPVLLDQNPKEERAVDGNSGLALKSAVKDGLYFSLLRVDKGRVGIIRGFL